MSDNKFVLVLNKDGVWEDKTDEIIECVIAPSGTRIQILFKNNLGKPFQYSQERVRQLEEPITTHNPAEVQLRVKGKILLGVDHIVKYADFYLVTSQGKRKPYSVSDVNIERNVAVDPACKTVLDYFRSISEVVGVQNDEDESLLAKQFDYLSRVSDASVLAAYLVPNSAVKALDAPEVLIYPFGTNVVRRLPLRRLSNHKLFLLKGRLVQAKRKPFLM